MSGILEHSDIEGLTLKVRDIESRRLISEAIAAYRGGALRSAIVSTWIAVVYDFIAKTRELATQGEPGPKAFSDELADAVDKQNIAKLLGIERDLLKNDDNNFQFLAQHELMAMQRLYEDRNLCAHPALVADEQLFRPSPEQVRTHIVHALSYLLIHAPLQGKGAIARFDSDLLSSSFPRTPKEINVHLRSKYLDRAKNVLVESLIKAVLIAPFGSERPTYIKKIRILAIVLGEISKIKIEIYESVMPKYVAKKFASIQGKKLIGICPFVAQDPRIWSWLDLADQTRIKRLIETSDAKTLLLNDAFEGLSVESLENTLTDRFDALPWNEQSDIISHSPRKEFVEQAIELYSDSGSYRTSEHLGESLILNVVDYFEPHHIDDLLKVVSENRQIWLAGGTSDILCRVFDITERYLQGTRKHWQRFVDRQVKQCEGDTTDRFAYPEIQRKLDSKK